jgi:hypothetical protein
MVCAKPPKGFYRWTLDLIVEQAQQRGLVGESISRETVRVLLKEHDLKPWQEKMWCIGQLDEEYIRRMEDVLDVYQRPYDPERPVVCVDEKPVPLISDQTPRLPLRGPGEVMLKDYEYVRGGSANVFCAVEPKAGVYFNKVTESRDGLGFSIFMSELAHRYAADRFEIHHTPVHASWLNQAEIAIGMYSRQCLGDGRVGDLGSLKTKTAAWNKAANKRRQVIQWRFTTAKARKSMGYDLGQHAETLS